MADQEFARYSVALSANADGYNRSIDAAVAKTVEFRVQQRELVREIAKNEEQQNKTAKSIENNKSSIEKNTAAIEKAKEKYGQNSTEVQKLVDKQKRLEQASVNLAQRVESLKDREATLGSQLKSVNAVLDSQQKELDETGNSAGKASQGLSKVSDKMGSLTKLMAGALTAQAGKSFLQATIGSLSEFEQYETSFAVMLGDMGKAQSLISDLKQFAANTPLGMTDLTGPTQTLLQFGVAAEDVLPTLKMLGDVSLGNKERFQSLALVFGQIQSTGKLMGQDFLQLIGNGFNPLQVMAEKTGKSVADLKEEMEDGAISAGMVTQAFKDATSEGGQFFGAMEAQSKTLAGTWSTLKDNLGQVMRDVGEDAFAETKTALKDISAEVDRMSKNGSLDRISKSWGSAFSLITKATFGATEGLLKNKEAVGALIAAFGAYKIVQQVAGAVQLYTQTVQNATKAQALFVAVTKTNPYVMLAGALTAIIGGMVAFSQATNDATSDLNELNETMNEIESGNFESARDRLAELRLAADQLLPAIEKMNESTNRSAGETELLKRYADNLNKTIGEEVAVFNEATGKVDLHSEAIRRNIQALEARAKADAAYDKMVELEGKQIENKEKLAEAQERLNAAREKDAKEYNIMEALFGSNLGYEVLGMDTPVQKAVRALSDAQSVIDKTDACINDLAVSYKELNMQAGESAQATDDFTFSLEIETKAVSDQFKELQKHHEGLKALKAAEDEYKDSQKLSVETLESLSEQYGSLKPYIDDYLIGLIDEKELMAQFPAIYAEDEQAQRDYLQAKAALSESFYKANILSNADLYKRFKENYGVDLKNFSSLAQTKGKIESQLISTLSESWGAYYKNVGGSASKTVEAMQKQLETLEASRDPQRRDPILKKQITDLQNMIEAMKPLVDLENLEFDFKLPDFSTESKKSSGSKSKEKTWQEKKRAELDYKYKMDLITEEEYLKGLEALRESYRGKDEDQFRKYDQEIYSMKKTAGEKVEKIVEDSFKNQLKIAQDYLKQQNDLIEKEYTDATKKINDHYDAEEKNSKELYEGKIDRIQGVIDMIDREIQAKRKARDEEKLEDDLSFAQKRIQTLQTQITYARSPEERAELEKELKRQQEELKDLTVQKEVNELEAQKQVHEDKLSQIQDEYKAEMEWLDLRRQKELDAAEEIRETSLKNIKATFDAFSEELHKTYEKVNDETLEIGKRFANATNEALKAGFTEVSNQAKSTVDIMLDKVKTAIAEMKSAINNISARVAEAHESERARSTSTYSDSRSSTITNHISNGLTAGQVNAMMSRQIEQVLYGRR